MKITAAARLLCGAAILTSAAGCQSVSRCCMSLFESRSATYADTTPVPEKADAVRTTSHSDHLPSAERGEPTLDSPESVTGKNRRFNIPHELPGADAAPLVLPRMDATQTIEERRSVADSLFPDIAPAEIPESPADGSAPLTLTTLQQMAIEHSPVIRQAAATVEEARGQAVQAGLYPNPTVGYQGDTIGTARTAGYNGVFFSQEFITAGKLTLAQNVALNDMRAAEADLRKARIRLASDVRRNYFRVLIAQEQLKFNRAIAELSGEVYKAQIDLVTGGESAPYEPLQLRVFAVQARNAVTQSSNSLEASWRQLAAAVGLPHMSRQHVTGSVEFSVPDVNYETLVTMLQRHSDLIAANARIASSTCNLRLQEAVPIPNVTLYAAFQHDDTTPLSDYSTNVQLSAPVPVFNRNQGNITVAHAGVVRARQDRNDTTNALMTQLAETYNRYSTSRVISESYRTDLLPDQVRVYRGVYDRFLIDGESIDFAQVVVAQQTLAQVVTSYLQSLTDVWMATVDLAELLQVDDLMTMDGMAASSSADESSNEPPVPPIPHAAEDSAAPPVSSELFPVGSKPVTPDEISEKPVTSPTMEVSTISSQDLKTNSMPELAEASGPAPHDLPRFRRHRPAPRFINP